MQVIHLLQDFKTSFISVLHWLLCPYVVQMAHSIQFDKILHTVIQWLRRNLQKIPHTSPSWVRYRVSSLAILEKIDWHHAVYSQIAKFMRPTWGPSWVLPAPGGPHVGPMNLAFRVGFPAQWSFAGLSSKLWGIYCEDLGKKWPWYSSTSLCKSSSDKLHSR